MKILRKGPKFHDTKRFTCPACGEIVSSKELRPL